MRRLLPLLATAATFGVVLALRKPTYLYFISLFVFLSYCFILRTQFKGKLLFLPSVFLLYYFTSMMTLSNYTSHYEEAPQMIKGTIHSIPTVDGDRFSMRFKSKENEVVQVQAFIKSEEEQQELRMLTPGDQCLIKAPLERPPTPTNFFQFNYREYLKEERIFWMVRPEYHQLQCTPLKDSAYMLERWRQKQLLKLEKEASPELAGIMAALLFGERSFMDGELLDAYQSLGVIHLLAVSGLHVGMVVAAFFYLLIRFGITRERAMEGLILFLPFYLFITGAAPPVVRASCMAIIVLICLRFKINVPPLNTIIFVYMGYLLLKPFDLFQLGFQLSFLISFALIVSAPLIQHRFSHPFTQMLCITVLSQLFSIPILLYHMYEMAWVSIPLNMIYIPFITMIVLPLTFLAYISFTFFPFLFNVPHLLLEWSVPIAHQALMYVASFRWARVITGKPHELIVIFLYIVLIYGCLQFEKGKRKWWLKPSCFFCLLLTIQMGAPYVDSRAKVTMLDVGQGDSYLIELPYRKEVYLIDTGGTIDYFDEEWRKRKRTFDVGANIVVPTLKERGISRIDRLVLTHGHIDHIGGAEQLSKAIKINEVLYGQGPVEGEEERVILKELMKQGAKLTFVKEGMGWKSGSAAFSVLSPIGTEIDLNARSIVLYAEMEDVSFLFTGDLEEKGEKRLVSTYPHLKADILKVGHHGSRTSTSEQFLDQVSPKAAFISAGRNNRFGHPHEEVMERLREHHVLIWRSDEGAVRLFIKKKKIKVMSIKKNG